MEQNDIESFQKLCENELIQILISLKFTEEEEEIIQTFQNKPHSKQFMVITEEMIIKCLEIEVDPIKRLKNMIKKSVPKNKYKIVKNRNKEKIMLDVNYWKEIIMSSESKYKQSMSNLDIKLKKSKKDIQNAYMKDLTDQYIDTSDKETKENLEKKILKYKILSL